MAHELSFLASRSAAASGNEEWSRNELGEWVAVLDIGCTLLELGAREVADHVGARGNSASSGEKVASLLSMWSVSRAGSVCALLLQGYPTDAGALLRSLLEVEALQTLLATEPDSADAWMRNEEIRVGRFLSLLSSKDREFGRAWEQLGTVVHPNRKAVINQVDELSAGAKLGGGGARRPEQLYKLTVNFGIQVKRELHVLERTTGFRWSEELHARTVRYEQLLDQMHAEVLRRWPSSEMIG